MKTTRLTDIGILLIQIDMRQRYLKNLFLQKKLKSVKAYRDQSKLLEEMGIKALQELSDLNEPSCWHGSKSTLESICHRVSEAKARSQAIGFNTACNTAQTSRTMPLRDIGILLIQIDMQECQLAYLILEGKFKLHEKYLDECNYLEELENRAVEELCDCALKIKLGSPCDPVSAATKDKKQKTRLKAAMSDNASDRAQTSDSRGQQ